MRYLAPLARSALAVLLTLLAVPCVAAEVWTVAPPLTTLRPRISLDGEWQFQLDKPRKGNDRHTAPGQRLPGRITVPGCWQAQGFGRDIWRMTHYSKDDGWYKKRFSIPSSWKGGRVWLRLGGVKPAANVWINGKTVGFTKSSRTPIKADVTALVRFGAENEVTINVTWPIERLDGVWDSDRINTWSGLYRSVVVERTPSVRINEIHVRPSARRPTAHVSVLVCGEPLPAENMSVKCRISPWNREGRTYDAALTSSFDGATSSSRVVLEVPMPEARLWSVEHPFLHTAEITLMQVGRVVDRATVRFGLRDVSTHGTRILLNGVPVFLRGGCDDHYYPETVCPPASKAFFLKRLRLLKAYGFNYVKSCVEVYTQEFLDAADELGIMVCEEMPFGLGGKYYWAATDPSESDQRLYRAELENIIRADRNHPSVILYSMNSEIKLTAQSLRVFGQELPRRARLLNPAALVMDMAKGFGLTRKTQYGERVTDIIEARKGKKNDIASLDALPPPLKFNDTMKLPFILHEYLWWSCLPKIWLKERYKGLPVKPDGIPSLERAAAQRGVAEILPQLVDNSRKLKWALRKEGLEYARRMSSVAGYHHWLVQDLNWCPEGVFNEFWEAPKGLSADEFRMYNSDTVLLLDDSRRCCYKDGAEISLALLVSHYGAKPLAGARLQWRVEAEKKILLQGQSDLSRLAPGTLRQVAVIRGKLPRLGRAAKILVRADLLDKTQGRINRNHWKLWVFPQDRFYLREDYEVGTDLAFLRKAYRGITHVGSGKTEAGLDLLITDQLGEATLEYLDGGGRVILLNRKGALPEVRGRDCSLYRSVPYNRGKGGNMGTIIARHPALRNFPHEGWCDYQFVWLIHGAYPMDLDALLPARIEPIVRSIGHYKYLKNKAYLFEARVGRGALLVASFNMAQTFGEHPETRFLMDQFLRYALNGPFSPKQELPLKSLRRIRDGGAGAVQKSAAVAADKGAVKLQNPGFELGAKKDTVPKGWAFKGPREEGIYDKAAAHSGKRSITIVPRSGKHVNWMQSRIPVAPGDVLRLSVWIKTEGLNGAAYFVLHTKGKTKKWYGPSSKRVRRTTDWKQVSVTFTVPDNMEHMNIYLRAKNATAGTVWFDDVTVVRNP